MIAATLGICEDDRELRTVLAGALGRAGFDVTTTSTGTEALAVFTRRPPTVLVLDVGLPDADGRDVCQALRARGIGVPVLFLTARDAITDRVSGFAAGGDDYLVKPFALAELVARVQALARRVPAPAPEPTAAGVVLDPRVHAIRNGALEVSLTPTEYRLLAALFATPGAIVRRHTLIAAAWPEGAVVYDNTLDTYLARIRRKMRAADLPEVVETIRGVGYILR